MYLEEQKENEPQQQQQKDEKPTHDQLVRMDSECLSSIINNNNEAAKKSKTLEHEQQHLGRVGDSYGAMELDFSSYAPHHSGGGVSLTLGLHQHEHEHGEGGGVSLAFSSTPAPVQQFYSRDEIQMEDHVQNHQYSLLESENQSLQYRNLMGAQLLHDLAG